MITPLTENQRQIIEENHNLIWDFLIRYRLNADEWYDILALACCKGVATYNPELGTISTYLYKCMQNAYYQELRILHNSNNNALSTSISLDNIIINRDGDSYCTIADIIPDPKDEILDKLGKLNVNDYLYALKCKLTNQEAIVLDYLLQEYRQYEIGKMMKLSRARISKLVYQIRKKANSIRYLFDI